jgi:hypothetical protein
LQITSAEARRKNSCDATPVRQGRKCSIVKYSARADGVRQVVSV